MYKIRPIHGYLKGWTWDADQKALRYYDLCQRSSLGVIQLVSIQNSKGEEIYQQPLWLESRGEVDIIVDANQHFILIEVERHAVIPPSDYACDWKGEPPDPFRHQSGVKELELPRGFANAFGQEAEEETGYKVEFVAAISHSNTNTAFFGTSPFVVVCKAHAVPSHRQPEPAEQIRRVVTKTPEEVAKLTTYCGLTKAALWDFCHWAFIDQKDPWWKKVAERIIEGWCGVGKEGQTVIGARSYD